MITDKELMWISAAYGLKRYIETNCILNNLEEVRVSHRIDYTDGAESFRLYLVYDKNTHGIFGPYSSCEWDAAKRFVETVAKELKLGTRAELLMKMKLQGII